MSKNRPAVKVARSASFLFLQTLGSVIIQIAAFAVIARFLSQTEMGILSTLFLALSLSNILINMGLSTATAKYIAALLGQGERKKAAGVCYQTLRLHIIFAAIGAFVFFILSDNISLFLLKSPDYAILFKILSLDLVAVSLHESLQGSASGLQKFREISVFNLIRLFSRQVLIILMLFLGYGLIGIALAWSIADLLNCVLFGTIIIKSFGMPSFNFSLRSLMSFSFPLYLSSVFSFTYAWFDKALLLAFFSLDDLGVYSVAQKPLEALGDLKGSMSSVLFPKYSELHGKNGKRSLENAILGASRYVSFIATPMAFGLLALAGPAISILAGSSYLSAVEPLIILSLFFGITSVGTAFNVTLLVLGKTWIESALNLLGIVVGSVLALLLSPSLGLNGIAAARGTTWILILAAYLWVIRKKINLKLDKDAIWKSIASSTVMAIALMAFQAFIGYQEYMLLPYIGGGILIYLLMLRTMKAIRQGDVELVKLYVGRRLEFFIKPFEFFLLADKQIEPKS
jgi:O-antigen/teichoic acid export membrane protein